MSALVELSKLAKGQESPLARKVLDLGSRGFENLAVAIAPTGKGDTTARLYATPSGVPEIALRKRVLEENESGEKTAVYHRVSFFYPDGRYLYLASGGLPEEAMGPLLEALKRGEETWGAAAADQARLVLGELLSADGGGGAAKLNVVWLTSDIPEDKGWAVVFGVEGGLWKQAAYGNEKGEKDAFTVTGKEEADAARLEGEALENVSRNLHLVLPGLIASA